MQITTINNANYHAFAPYLDDEKEDGCGYLGVIEDGQAIAAGAFSMEWPVLIIKNLYVAPNYRRRDAAKLFAALAEELETVDTAERYLYFLGRNIQLVQSLQSVFGDDLKRMATGWSAIRNSHRRSGKGSFSYE